MPIFPGKLFLQGDNSGSFPIVESQHSRGTAFVIDDLTSASLAVLGSGVTGTAGIRDLGSIVFEKSSKKYYVFQPATIDTDTNISGSIWTTLNNWKELAFNNTGSSVSLNHITASGNISASGTVFADKFVSAGGDDQIEFDDNLYVTGHITASGNISSSGEIAGATLDINGTGNISGDTTFGGHIILNADNKIKSDTDGNYNFIEFDDDSGSPANQTSKLCALWYLQRRINR